MEGAPAKPWEGAGAGSAASGSVSPFDGVGGAKTVETLPPSGSSGGAARRMEDEFVADEEAGAGALVPSSGAAINPSHRGVMGAGYGAGALGSSMYGGGYGGMGSMYGGGYGGYGSSMYGGMGGYGMSRMGGLGGYGMGGMGGMRGMGRYGGMGGMGGMGYGGMGMGYGGMGGMGPDGMGMTPFQQGLDTFSRLSGVMDMMVESIHMSISSVMELAERLGYASHEMQALGTTISIMGIIRAVGRWLLSLPKDAFGLFWRLLLVLLTWATVRWWRRKAEEKRAPAMMADNFNMTPGKGLTYSEKTEQAAMMGGDPRFGAMSGGMYGMDGYGGGYGGYAGGYGAGYSPYAGAFGGVGGMGSHAGYGGINSMYGDHAGRVGGGRGIGVSQGKAADAAGVAGSVKRGAGRGTVDGQADDGRVASLEGAWEVEPGATGASSAGQGAGRGGATP